MIACLAGLAVPTAALLADYLLVGTKPDAVCAVLFVPMWLGYWMWFSTWGRR